MILEENYIIYRKKNENMLKYMDLDKINPVVNDFKSQNREKKNQGMRPGILTPSIIL